MTQYLFEHSSTTHGTKGLNWPLYQEGMLFPIASKSFRFQTFMGFQILSLYLQQRIILKQSID